jgi:hypothetical protein
MASLCGMASSADCSSGITDGEHLPGRPLRLVRTPCQIAAPKMLPSDQVCIVSSGGDVEHQFERQPCRCPQRVMLAICPICGSLHVM